MDDKDTKTYAYAILALMFMIKLAVAQQTFPKQISLYLPETLTPKTDSVELPKEQPLSERSAEVWETTAAIPLNSLKITSDFGWRIHPLTGKLSFHSGVDLAASAQVVYSILPGIVESIGYHTNLGKFIRIDHGFVHSIYGHLSRIIVNNGQQLPAGFPIGITGTTGRTTGEHLHFSIRRKNIYINPWKFLRGLSQSMKQKQLNIYGQ
ncbi:hypothetical protein BWD42_06995 [Sphingobacterium sp. CZ-UAM]|uniref:M23 family metallopeptidase n=1 Tax=Sphingobacterium sp. CZ-UAM TaxID=1933868 RepID=UPI0009867582|nr:M23 family metallopeptidase [Sphingobacterium sp. CZ-UAM]OOG19652.1 hypothetical protein BWD42_06995 [Sphingobacterium sp. CZ-UAM]